MHLAVDMRWDPKAALLWFYTLGRALGQGAQLDLGCSCTVHSGQPGTSGPSHNPKPCQGLIPVMGSWSIGLLFKKVYFNSFWACENEIRAGAAFVLITENEVMVIKNPLPAPDSPEVRGAVRCLPISWLAPCIPGSSPLSRRIQQQLEKIKGLFHFICR